MSRRIFNVSLLGTSGVGKTSLVTRITKNNFEEQTNATIGAMFVPFKISVNDNYLQLSFWDTAGEEKYTEVAKQYYRTADIILLVFDFSKPKTINRLLNYARLIQEVKNDVYRTIIVGNKTDLVELDYVISVDRAIRNHLNNFNINIANYIYLSAKTTFNINQLKEQMISICLYTDVAQPKREEKVIDLPSPFDIRDISGKYSLNSDKSDKTNCRCVIS